MRHTAAYDWRRIHSATPQRNALTCRDGCAFLSGEGSSYGHGLGFDASGHGSATLGFEETGLAPVSTGEQPGGPLSGLRPNAWAKLMHDPGIYVVAGDRLEKAK